MSKNQPEGFRFSSNKTGEVTIFHHGRVAAKLKGRKAAGFLTFTSTASETVLQHKMARLTGNYKRGNEKQNL